MRWRLLVAAAALSALAGGATGLGVWLLLPPDPQGPAVEFVVEPGTSLTRLARDLEAARLVRHARAVEWWGRLRGVGSQLRAGEYDLSPALAPSEILDRIARGQVMVHEVVIPEGLTAAEIGARLAAARLVDAANFLEVVQDPASAPRFAVEGESLEGYLFPETYHLARGLPTADVVKLMVDQFHGVWAEIAARAREEHLSMREVVTLASIVEKETAVPAERPLIAAVFRNRLRRGMRLETDPAVIYGIPSFDGNLTRQHLGDEANRYNTYRIVGLPPGPIANPGAGALRAVVEPAQTEYLYFVSRNDGTHQFSRSYDEHVTAVNRYQRGQD